MHKIKVNQDKCISCGSCVAICPDIFDFNDNNKAEANENINNLDTMDERCPRRLSCRCNI